MIAIAKTGVVLIGLKVAVVTYPFAPTPIQIAGANAAQTASHFDLSPAGAGSVQQEPANKRNPQTGESGSHKEANNSRHDECEGNDLADPRRDPRRAHTVTGHSPDDPAQDTSAIERKSRNQIEDC